MVLGFPDGSGGKEAACQTGDLGSIPGSGKSPGEENGYPVQYFHGILASKSQIRQSNFHFTQNLTNFVKFFKNAC